ncbi:MAG: cyclic nucleotide-binding domain-containing protein [Mariprofundaceae bacterium]
MANDQSFLDLSGVSMPKYKPPLNEDTFPILKSLPPVHLRILNSASRVMHVSNGVEILQEGEAAHDLYFVRSGKLAITKRVDDKMQMIAHLHSGDLYGEFGALRKKSRYASVLTVEASEIIRVELAAVHQVMEVDKDFCERLDGLLRQRMLDSYLHIHAAFKGLPKNIRPLLAQSLPVRFISRGQTLFAQNDAPCGVYLILSGEAEVRCSTESGAELVLEIRRDGDMLGEVATRGGKNLAYSAVAASDLDLLQLDEDTMRMIRKKHAETCKLLEDHIDERALRTVCCLKENR